MRKLLTLLTVVLVGIAAFAGLRRAGEKSVTYALEAGDTFTSGQTVDVKDGDDIVATITYGETGGADFNAAAANSSVEGFTAFTAGNGVNGNKTGGTFYTIVPKIDGKIEVAVVLNADKAFYVEEDGTALTDYDGITVKEKYYGTYTFDVKADKSYKVYCSGSKLGFYGFKLSWTTEDPVETSYYIVGSVKGWDSKDYVMTANPANDAEYMFVGTFAKDEGIKVMSSASAYYPDGTGNEFVIPEDGEYTIYFRPDGQGGSDWHYGYIYAAKKTTTDPDPELNTYTATFTTNAGWEEVYAYAWTTTGEGEEAVTKEFLGEWPGKKLEAVDGVYTVTIKAEAAPANIIFNNGAGVQTEDLVFENEKAYTYEAPVVAQTATFNFADPNFRENVGEAMTDTKGYIYNETFTVDGATLQITAGSAPSRIYVDANRGQNLVTYKEYTTLTFKAPEGKAITKIEFTAAGNSNIKNFTASSGTIEGMVWTGNADGVRFLQGGTSYLANAIVTLEGATEETATLPAIEYTECANIAAFNALEAGTYAKLTLTDAEVIGKSADGYSTVFVQDATGGAWIQYTSLNDKLQEKNKVNGTIYTIKRANSGNSQIKEAEATINSEFTSEAIDAYTMVEGTIEEVNVAANLNKVVKITGAKLEMTSATAGTLTVGESTISVNNGNATANQQLCKIADWEKDKTLENVTITAILVGGSSSNQLYPISIETPLVINSMAIVGDFLGLATEENPNANWDLANGWAMTQSTENPAIWTLTKENVEVEGKKYEYKATANGNWTDYVLPNGDNADFVFGTDEYPAGKYNLTFTVNTEEHTLTLNAEKVKDPIVINSMAIVGDFLGLATEENPNANWDLANGWQMTQNAENKAIWTLTKEFTAEAKKYEYKATANGNWTDYVLPNGDNADFVFGTDEYPAGTYNLTFTVNTDENTLTLDVQKAVEPVTGIIPDGTYYVMAASEGKVINASGALDAKGAPITFTFDATTETYAITGVDFFAGKQWTIAEATEGESGYYTISNADGFVAVSATLGLEQIADGTAEVAVWMPLQQAYWEDIVNSTYTVAGTANLTGTANDWVVSVDNQMTLNEKTGLFEKKFKKIAIDSENQPEFKVVQTNMEGVETWYPEGGGSTNWVITTDYVGGEGLYDITITFDPSDYKEINVIAQKRIVFPEDALVYDFEAASDAGENPGNKNGSAANGQAFYGWEAGDKTDSKRQDYKGYEWAEGSVLPKICQVWRRSDRINGNVKNGGLYCPSDKEMAIDGLEVGDKVIIVYDAENATNKDIIWAIGDGTSEGGPGTVRATATINGTELVTGESTIASGAEIVLNSVTPAENGSGYIVFKVKKGMIIQQIAVIPAQEIAEDIYTVVGDEALTGANWDVNYRGSEMDQNPETGLYEWNSTPVDILEGTELGFKIVKNNAYENGEWPAGYGNNWVIKIGATNEIDKAGNYTFNITFNPENGEIGVNATYNGPATGIASIKAAQENGAAIYTLQGVRVNNVKKGGMYIINGRKVAVK